MNDLTLSCLAAANRERCREWMGDLPKIKNIAFHALELGGECGEAQNICKKIDRWRQGIPGAMHPDDARDSLAEELADVIICCSMVALTLDINLGAAVTNKFNATSEKHGFKVKL